MKKANLLPPIGHYDLYMRDRLCDLVNIFCKNNPDHAFVLPLKNMKVLKNWKHVDMVQCILGAPCVCLGRQSNAVQCSQCDGVQYSSM